MYFACIQYSNYSEFIIINMFNKKCCNANLFGLKSRDTNFLKPLQLNVKTLINIFLSHFIEIMQDYHKSLILRI